MKNHPGGASRCDKCGETVTDIDAGFSPGLQALAHECGGTWRVQPRRTNHPGRKLRPEGTPPLRMTPEHLRDLIRRAGITQARAAELAGVAERTLRQYLAGDRAMPLSASQLLCTGCAMLGAPVGLLEPWLSRDSAAQLRALQDAGHLVVGSRQVP